MVQHLYRISKQHVEDVWFFLQTNNVDLFQVKPPVYAFLSGETISYIVCKNQTFTGLCTDIWWNGGGGIDSLVTTKNFQTYLFLICWPTLMKYCAQPFFLVNPQPERCTKEISVRDNSSKRFIQPVTRLGAVLKLCQWRRLPIHLQSYWQGDEGGACLLPKWGCHHSLVTQLSLCDPSNWSIF